MHKHNFLISFVPLFSLFTVGCNNSQNEDTHISLILPWINTVDISSIVKIKAHNSLGSLVPGNFETNFYSTNREDIKTASLIFNSYLLDERIDACYGCTSNVYSYFVENNVYSIQITDNNNSKYLVVYDEENGYREYLFRDDTVFPALKHTSQAYNLLVANDESLVYYFTNDGEYKTIDYLNKIEFIEINDNDDLGVGKYYINDFSSKLTIYSKDIFEYKDIFYRIVSETNFSSLFD